METLPIERHPFGKISISDFDKYPQQFPAIQVTWLDEVRLRFVAGNV
jgi:hypothetical protein